MPWLRPLVLLTPPVGWFAFIYLAALVVLFVSAFWQVNAFTTEIEHVWSLGNFRTIFESSAYRTVALRTIELLIQCNSCGRHTDEGAAERNGWGYLSDGVELYPVCPACLAVETARR